MQGKNCCRPVLCVEHCLSNPSSITFVLDLHPFLICILGLCKGRAVCVCPVSSALMLHHTSARVCTLACSFGTCICVGVHMDTRVCVQCVYCVVRMFACACACACACLCVPVPVPVPVPVNVVCVCACVCMCVRVCVCVCVCMCVCACVHVCVYLRVNVCELCGVCVCVCLCVCACARIGAR